MKLNYTFKLFKCLVVAVVACFASALYAQTPKWEKIHDFPGTNDFFITKTGNLLMADLLFDWNTYVTYGGIYISKDKGETWTKTGAKDYCYNYFIENDEYIFAAAGACRVARSNDGGETWEMLSYQNQVADVLGEENLEYALAYSMAIYDDKLFVGDFTGGGIVYSADNGETWVATDVETLKYDAGKGEKTKELQADKKDTRVVENIYNMMVYNGDLYAFGTCCVFKYLPETNSWETLDINSNFMAVGAIYEGKLCTGRSVPNFDAGTPFIVTLDENGVWGELGNHATEDYDCNIRAMHSDGSALYIGMQTKGFYYTQDGGYIWECVNEGLPYNEGDFTPMRIKTDAEYIYLAAYSQDNNSGLYRLAKKDLNLVDAISDVNDNSGDVKFDGAQLKFGASTQSAAVYDMSGRLVLRAAGNNVNVNHLNSGAYLYKAVQNGKSVCGKFMKK
jgi:hypothetical protein